MNLCEYGHDAVCYETRQCPMCALEQEKSAEIQVLEDRIADLEQTVNDLSSVPTT
jgi:hypothetical protein